MKKLNQISLFLRPNIWRTPNKLCGAQTLPWCLKSVENTPESNSRFLTTHNHNPSNDSNSKYNLFKYLNMGLFATVGFCAFNYVKKHNDFEFLKPLHALSIPLIQENDKEDKSNIPPSRSNNFIADVVEKVASAVVYIEVIGRHPYTNQPMTLSNGSGFIVEKDGLILTNAHVVGNERFVSCKLYDGRVFKAVVEDRDPQKDLATLRISANDLPTIKLGESSKVRPGEFVVAMGSPLSLSNTITAGIISSVHRASKELGLPNSEMEYIQTDASITFGNSGGPLVNLDGEAIAINTMKVTAGISFAIPADYAKEFLELSRAKKDKGWFKWSAEQKGRRYLGITMLTLTPSIIAELQQRRVNFPNVTHGVLVWKIVIDSPAHQSGIHPGDVITHINQKEIVSSQDVYKAINEGKPLRLSIRRDQYVLELTVRPEEIAL